MIVTHNSPQAHLTRGPVPQNIIIPGKGLNNAPRPLTAVPPQPIIINNQVYCVLLQLYPLFHFAIHCKKTHITFESLSRDSYPEQLTITALILRWLGETTTDHNCSKYTFPQESSYQQSQCQQKNADFSTIVVLGQKSFDWAPVQLQRCNLAVLVQCFNKNGLPFFLGLHYDHTTVTGQLSFPRFPWETISPWDIFHCGSR